MNAPKIVGIIDSEAPFIDDSVLDRFEDDYVVDVDFDDLKEAIEEDFAIEMAKADYYNGLEF